MAKNKKIIFIGIVAVFIAIFSALWIYVDSASSSAVPILMYHAIRDSEEPNSLCVSPEVFTDQIEFLAKNHYNVVGPAEIIKYMLKKEKMPPKTVAITVDDGFYNFYKYAYPLLKKYHFKATVFIITDKIGRPGRLGWKELREMSDSGLVTVASHTQSHPWLPEVSVDPKKICDELAGSKAILEKGLGKSVDYICYPNGGFNDLVKETAKSAGYKGGFTTNPSRHSAIDDIYAIRRIKISSSSRNPFILWVKTSRYYTWFKERR